MINNPPEYPTPFIGKQLEFADFIRDPEHHAAPQDVELRRMQMYRELFFNNVNEFLISNFPVLHTLIAADQWFALVQDFFGKHTCKTPYFSEIPEEFLTYLQNQPPLVTGYPPFILELAHYEWVEMALSIAKETLPEINSGLVVDALHHPATLSPLAWPLLYQWPVHQISPAYQPDRPPGQHTYLIVYRDRKDNVNFIHITALTYQLLEILQESASITVAECLAHISRTSEYADQAALENSALPVIKTLAEKQIILFV